MVRPDPEVLAGFLEEVRDYVPTIRGLVESLVSRPSDPTPSKEAYRLAHIVTGSAGMLGLNDLSEAARCMELALEQVAMGHSVDASDLMLVDETLNTIDEYVRGDVEVTDPLIAIVSAWLTRSSEPVVSPVEIAPPTKANLSLASVSPELLEVFALESEEHLRIIRSSLQAMEHDLTNRELLQQVRRSSHTLKGSAAMVGIQAIQHLAHRMEDLLDGLYDGGRSVTEPVLQLLVDTADTLDDLASGRGDQANIQSLYEQYSSALAGVTPAVEVDEPVAAPAEWANAPVEMPELMHDAASPDVADAVKKAGQFLRMPIDRLDEMVKLVTELVISRAEFEQRLGSLAKQIDELQLSTSRLGRAAGKLEAQYEARALSSNRLIGLPGMPANRPYGFDDLEFDRYTDFHLLTRELSETTSDIRTVSGELANLNREFDGYLTRQTRLSGELQDKLTRARMVPISTLFTRLDRTARTAARSVGKQVELVLEGDRTEIDKTVLEEMSEPLLHLLRNAVDHGIEHPEERAARGKGPVGVIRVRATTEGTQVVIRVSDDGRGVDHEKVRGAIVARGVMAADEAARLSSHDLEELLFQPGLTTASAISELSGRGVGLDVVREQVRRLKGTVSLETQFGHGTTFVVRLPLTLAVMRALLVRANSQTFAIPLAAVTQISRLEDGQVDRIGDDSVIRWNGKVYPRVHLGQAMNIKAAPDEHPRPPIIMLRTGERDMVLVVDSIVGGREIVVKSLGAQLRRLRGVAGATIMGDGSVVLIINPADLLRTERTSPKVIVPTQASRPSRRTGTKRIMIVDDSPSVRRVVSAMLKSAGWEPVVAKDGVEALELLHRDGRPDAVLLDVEMPRMDGYELLSTIRAAEAYRDLPVVMLTSRAGDKHRRKAMDLGASAYLVKPYQDEALLKLLHELTQPITV